MCDFTISETVFDKIEEFIIHKKSQGVCDATITTYRNHFRAIKVSNSEIDDVNWERVIQSVWELPVADYTKVSYLRSLKAFMNWLGIKPLPRIPVIETIKETYTDEELRKLTAKPKKANFAQYRTWVIILLTIDTGLRASSIRNIKIRDICDNTVTVRHTKTRKVQVLPFSDTTKAAINSFLRHRGGNENDYLFCDIYGNQLSANGLKYSVRKYNLSKGVSKTSIHMLRHTFAKKWLLDCDGNTFTLQKMLGHSTMDMTKHYANLWDSDIISNYVSPLEKIQKKQLKM